MNTPLPVLVVDDERPARSRVVRFLRDDPRFVVVGEACDGVEALELIEALAPAVVVLDIQMPGLDGFEVLAALGEQAARFAVVFSTAFDAHALRAFEVHAVDYLLKPYEPERLIRAMDKAYAQCLHAGERDTGALRQLAAQALAVREKKQVALKTVAGVWLTIAPTDILRLVAANKHTRIVLAGSEQLVRLPLSELAERLDDRFVRVHRSEFVNVDGVRSVQPWTHGDGILVLQDGSTLVLTRTYREAFLARLAAR